MLFGGSLRPWLSIQLFIVLLLLREAWLCLLPIAVAAGVCVTYPGVRHAGSTCAGDAAATPML